MFFMSFYEWDKELHTVRHVIVINYRCEICETCYCESINYRSKIRNSSIVRINSSLPHPVNQDLTQVQQNSNLAGKNTLYIDSTCQYFLKNTFNFLAAQEQPGWLQRQGRIWGRGGRGGRRSSRWRWWRQRWCGQGRAGSVGLCIIFRCASISCFQVVG